MNGPIAILLSLAGFFFGFSAIWTGLEIVEDVVQPRTLTLQKLQYNGDGTVTQQLDGGIPANWAAQITRKVDGVDRVLCSGSGRGPGYVGELQTYTTSDWTFDECPSLVPGDIGVASWEFVNETGATISITGRFVVDG